MKLFFLRHGNTFESDEIPLQLGSQSDIEMTKYGIQQCKKANNFFKKNNIIFEQIYSGPLKRHKQCAEIFNKEYLIKNELNEIDYGLWEKLSSHDIQSQWPQEYLQWTQQGIWPKKIFNNSEQLHINNIKNLMIYIKSHHIKKDNNILLITSQGVIRYLLTITNSWDTIQNSKQMSQYKVGTGNFCTLEYSDKIKIINWNQSP